MKKSGIILCLAAFLFVCVIVPVRAEGKICIGVSIPTADHGWTSGVMWWAEKAIKDFGKKYPDIEFIYRPSDSDKAQAADIEDMLEKNIDALVILPHKPAPLTTVLNKVNKSGAFIVVVDRSIPKVPKDVFVSGDNYQFGRKSGDFMAAALAGKGNILIMEGIPCEGNTLRINGFKEGIKDFSGIVVMDSQPAYWNPDKGYELMQQYLQQFPQIDAVWAGDDDVLESALKAYEESGRKDITLFLGGGGSKHIFKRILDGDPLVRGTVTYPPNQSYEGIRIAVERLKEGKTFDLEITIPSELVTKENAKDFYYPDSAY